MIEKSQTTQMSDISQKKAPSFRLHQVPSHVWTALLLAAAMLFFAVLRCAMDGKLLTDVYLPSSPWNDELFYYKLTQSVVHFGYPQGYFGFNESHGLLLSFAAWSPVLLLFWVIWGVLFGWGLLSPMLCNIALMAIGMFVFGMVMKPDRKQTIWILAFLAAFTPLTRYLLSGMPEVQCFVLLLLFFTAGCRAEQTGQPVTHVRESAPQTGRPVTHVRESASQTGRPAVKTAPLAAMFLTAVLLTWMRPYYLLLFLTPFLLWKKRSGLRLALPGSAAIVAATAAVYAAINHYLSAPYLTDLFYTDWLTAYRDHGLLYGLHYTLWKLAQSLRSVAGMVREAVFGAGLASGALYLTFFGLLVVWLVFWIRGLREAGKKKSTDVTEMTGTVRATFPLLLQFQLLLCMAGFGAADLLMYRLTEGSKHTAAFLVISLCFLPFMGRKGSGRADGTETAAPAGHVLSAWFQPVVLFLLLCYLFVVKADIPYDYGIPYRTAERSAQLTQLQEQLDSSMTLTAETPNYDNTVIWALWDQVDGKTQATDFGAFYMIPEGFGINLCDGGFIAAHLEGLSQGSLQSRYIAAPPGGEIEQKCLQIGARKVGSCSSLVVYDLKQAKNS